MVLHRPVELARQTGHVRPSTHYYLDFASAWCGIQSFGGKATCNNNDLAIVFDYGDFKPSSQLFGCIENCDSTAGADSRGAHIQHG